MFPQTQTPAARGDGGCDFTSELRAIPEYGRISVTSRSARILPDQGFAAQLIIRRLEPTQVTEPHVEMPRAGAIDLVWLAHEATGPRVLRSLPLEVHRPSYPPENPRAKRRDR